MVCLLITGQILVDKLVWFLIQP